MLGKVYCNSRIFQLLSTLFYRGFPGSSAGKESVCNERDLGSIPGSGRSPGEGNSYALQYSCLENSMDRGGWQDTVLGVTKSWTQLSDWHFHFQRKNYKINHHFTSPVITLFGLIMRIWRKVNLVMGRKSFWRSLIPSVCSQKTEGWLSWNSWQGHFGGKGKYVPSRRPGRICRHFWTTQLTSSGRDQRHPKNPTTYRIGPSPLKGLSHPDVSSVQAETLLYTEIYK